MGSAVRWGGTSPLPQLALEVAADVCSRRHQEADRPESPRSSPPDVGGYGHVRRLTPAADRQMQAG